MLRIRVRVKVRFGSGFLTSCQIDWKPCVRSHIPWVLMYVPNKPNHFIIIFCNTKWTYLLTRQIPVLLVFYWYLLYKFIVLVPVLTTAITYILIGRKWNGGRRVLFVKKWTLPSQNETKLNQTFLFYFTFYLFGWGAYAPNAPPAYGHKHTVLLEV